MKWLAENIPIDRNSYTLEVKVQLEVKQGISSLQKGWHNKTKVKNLLHHNFYSFVLAAIHALYMSYYFREQYIWRDKRESIFGFKYTEFCHITSPKMMDTFWNLSKLHSIIHSASIWMLNICQVLLQVEWREREKGFCSNGITMHKKRQAVRYT